MKLLIRLYQAIISPLIVTYFGHSCRYTPTCSDYFLMSLSKYGFFKGTLLGFKRILTCNPLSKGGYSPLN